jgi:1,4-alpha-glucan branching enzyme
MDGIKNQNIEDQNLWYKDAVFYELYVRAYRDSNGDGHGDLRGVIEKLDYLQELGVTCLWLLPVYPSPLKDDGYDIADYYGVLSEYASLEDFKALLDEAHQRGLRVIADLVTTTPALSLSIRKIRTGPGTKLPASISGTASIPPSRI